MPRTTKPLSDYEIKNSKERDKDYKLFDGDGLFLLVKSNGSKLWRIKCRVNSKETSLGIGSYPSMSLTEARKKLHEIKNDISNGIHPASKKKELEGPKKIYAFKSVAEEFLKFKSHELSSEYFYQQKRRLEQYTYTDIGNIPIDHISKSDIVKLIKNIPNVKTQSTKATRKSETGRIVFNLLEQIFKWGLHNDLTTNPVMSTIDKNSLIPKEEVKHFSAITDIKELRIVYKMIDDYQGHPSTRNALLFIMISALRSANIRFMKWEYIDFEKKIINYPKEAMKAKQSYRLPLTDMMMELIMQMDRMGRCGEYVFYSPVNKTKPLSENALGYGLRRMDIFDHTPHGFRTSFSTICHELQREHGYSSEVIETQLSHAVGGKVKQAYLRSDFLEERRELLVWWEKYIMQQ